MAMAKNSGKSGETLAWSALPPMLSSSKAAGSPVFCTKRLQTAIARVVFPTPPDQFTKFIWRAGKNETCLALVNRARPNHSAGSITKFS
jgi:hypothetical protein